MSLFQPFLELLCAEMQIRFYHQQGEYVDVADLQRLLAKCSSTPDLLLRKLLESGIIGITDKPNVVVIK
ncbi:hypothetical protein AFV7_gp47 [Betalipothrixvirus pezzuloense]|uniref:Uncharacterized protein n=1 Tax=Betalipothrixvirus pezzuloense TaxID=346883 RepID=A7WKR4_9VIRU|nr:hypothetical protein AFV7_gp47 [Acidianus filamentous virus 7]CAJ31667.1 conserved hypothetical protein [Acidianus filamentous virus 7]